MGLCSPCVSELGAPTSVDLVSSEPAHMVTSFTTGHIGLFNMETQQLILKLDSAGPPGCSDLKLLYGHFCCRYTANVSISISINSC